MTASADTIFALSTAPGRAGVAVVRISGPGAGLALDAMASPRPRDREAAFRAVRDPSSREVLDRAVVLYFAAPRSETGEDVAELQLHGSRAVVRSVLDALARRPGCRMAEPGEFARRAFENGKLDLTAVEGLADLVEAETEAQRRQALRQASGELARLYDGWRTRLIEASALVEAGIDFSDEADISSSAFSHALAIVSDLRSALERHLADGRRGEILRDGFRVVLAGPPNAGKSSLLNALARRDVAIVSDEAGTTRDAIEVRLDLGGVPVIVTDTAGLREASGKVEAEGIRRTLARAEEADLVIWLSEATAPASDPPTAILPVEGEHGRGRGILSVRTKIDLTPLAPRADELAVSSVTGQGIAELTARITSVAAERVTECEAPVITQPRHRQLVESCARHLADFLVCDPDSLELRAEDLRRAARDLGRITGRVDVEDVLDQIFSRFCIGK